jgi:hypothetical protein
MFARAGLAGAFVAALFWAHAAPVHAAGKVGNGTAASCASKALADAIAAGREGRAPTIGIMVLLHYLVSYDRVIRLAKNRPWRLCLLCSMHL